MSKYVIILIDRCENTTDRVSPENYYDYTEIIKERIQEGFYVECHLKNDEIEPENKVTTTIMTYDE